MAPGLAALAAGRPVPLPHQDPEVLAALQAALAREPLIVAAALTSPDQRVTATGGPDPDPAGQDPDGPAQQPDEDARPEGAGGTSPGARPRAAGDARARVRPGRRRGRGPPGRLTPCWPPPVTG